VSTYKNIRIPKRGGGSRLQRVQVLASGKYMFVKNKPRSGGSTRKTSSKKKGGRSMGGRRKFTIPIGIMAPLIGTLVEPAKRAYYGDFEGAFDDLSIKYTGYSPRSGQWNARGMQGGLLPLLIGFAIHWIAGKLGVNRALGRAGVPILRI